MIERQRLNWRQCEAMIPRIAPKPETPLQIKCSSCGATADAACDCGAAYVPAGARAAKAIEKNPGRSNRALAADIGVDEGTVRKARQSTAGDSAAQPRVGLDGKRRRLPFVRQSSLSLSAGDVLAREKRKADRAARERREHEAANAEMDAEIERLEAEAEQIALDLLKQIDRDFVFFFSSRRRHTRFDCDWSSDVCSSD